MMTISQRLQRRLSVCHCLQLASPHSPAWSTRRGTSLRKVHETILHQEVITLHKFMHSGREDWDNSSYVTPRKAPFRCVPQFLTVDFHHHTRGFAAQQCISLPRYIVQTGSPIYMYVPSLNNNFLYAPQSWWLTMASGTTSPSSSQR